MKQKLLFFFLTAFLSLIGGGELWAGAHTVVFNYDEDGLLRTQFTRPTGGNSTTIVSSPITLTFISTSTRSVNSSDGQMKFEGANNDAKDNGSSLQVSCLSNALITSISFTSAATKNVYNFTPSEGEYTAESSSTIGTWTGQTTSVTFTTENGNVDKITSISVTYSDVVVAYSDSYPYTWDFTNWETTASTLESDANWSDSAPYAYKTSLSTAAALKLSSGDLKETKGLKFENSASTRIVANPDNYLQMYSTVIVVPSLKKGHVVTFTTNTVSSHSGNAQISVSDVNITRTTLGDKYVFTYNAVTDGDVRFNVQALADDPLQILSIAVEKGEFTMSLNSTDLNRYAGTTGTGESKNNSSDPGSMADIESIVYDAAHPYIRMKLNLNKLVQSEIGVAKADYATYFKATNSSDATVLDVSNSYASQVGSDDAQSTDGKGNRVYIYDVKMLKPGESNLTFKFIGGDDFGYAEKEITAKVVIIKSLQTLSFAEAAKYVNYGQDAPENALTQTPAVGGGDVSYSSSDTHVATVDAETGALTIHNAGTCDITATAAETETYGEATASYKLTVYTTKDTPTITMTQNPGTQQAQPIEDGDPVITTYGNTVKVTGECSVSGPTVKYRSSDTSVATVDDNGVVTTVSGGTTTITVYTETYQGYPDASVTYTLTVNPTSFTLAFTPTSGKVNVGKTITPQMTLPTLMLNDLKTVTASSDDTSVATVPSNLMETEGGNYKYLEVSGGRVNRFLPIITGVAEGTAHITVRFTSNNYNSTTATYAVTVTAAGTCNFSWVDGETPTYTMYVGDYMKMPEISGNSNGNDSYSKKDAQKYIYYIEADKNKVTWNTDGYYLYEGVPDYGIIDNGTEVKNGTHAAIFYAKGQPSNGIPHTLFLYARAAGTVTVRAYDPQNHDLYCDATLKILERTTIDNAASTYINGMKFPYTWDFTGNFDMTDIVANSHYWERFDDNHYAAGIGFFNVDWADSDADDNYNERSFKPFVAGAATGTTAGNYMPLFYGLEMSLQNSAYAPKVDRVRITDYNSSNPDAARLVINGGTTQLRLPKAPTQPSNYRIYMKVKTTSGTKIEVGGKKYGVEEYTTGNQLTANTDAIIYFDVTNTSSADAGSVINLDNVSIYWIATSTEAKILNYYKETNPHLTYAAAAYSYNEDLDLTKSNEVNGGAAYYASSFTTDNNKDAGAFADDGNQYAVVMTPLTTMGNYVTANTGMLLKYDNVSEYTTDTQIPFYMIANPRNVGTYSATETIDGTTHKNFLVGTGSGISSLSGHEKIESIEYTNFLMAAAYKYYTDVTDANTVQGGYRFDRDWSFYPIMGSGAVPTQRSYLHIPGNLYVNSSGQIVDMPTSARAAFDVDSAADETAEAPATKGALNIVFEEEQPATPDDPATEEPEDGDSDKDKDRPRKPGDDGWPKPPFPPFPPIITDIDSVNTETTDNAVWHSMEGVRISQPTKPGLYIRNGKKVVIK